MKKEEHKGKNEVVLEKSEVVSDKEKEKVEEHGEKKVE